MILVAKLSEAALGGGRAQGVFWGVMLALFFSVVGVFFSLIMRMISRPIKTLTDSFSLLERGDFGAHIVYNGSDEFRDLYDGYNKMTGRPKRLIAENEGKEIFVQRAEMKLLQAQTSPHFMYNSFWSRAGGFIWSSGSPGLL